MMHQKVKNIHKYIELKEAIQRSNYSKKEIESVLNREAITAKVQAKSMNVPIKLYAKRSQ